MTRFSSLQPVENSVSECSVMLRVFSVQDGTELPVIPPTDLSFLLSLKGFT